MYKVPPSVISLIAANLITVYGVLFLNWSFSNVLLLYWVESAIIGISTVIKMLFANPGPTRSHLAKLLVIPFFLVHYGGFMAGHLVFLLLLTTFIDSGQNGGEFPVLFDHMLTNLSTVIPAVVGLVISHFVSLIHNYFGQGEYTTKTVMDLFGSPYSRIFVMHLTLLLGMFISFLLGQHKLIILLFVGLKIVADIQAHLTEHKTLHSTFPLI